jgi:hypothetical protein
MEATEREDNLERQEEEASALNAIYGDDFEPLYGDATIWTIRIPLNDGTNGGDDADTGFTPGGFAAARAVAVRVVLLDSYPSRRGLLLVPSPFAAELTPTQAITRIYSRTPRTCSS